jgi:hypothetical protein
MLGAILLAPSHALAQAYSATTAPHAGSFEISGGVTWTGGYEAGSGAAMESPNSSTGGTPLTLFTSSARVPAVAGVEARAGVYLGARVSAEASFQFSRPRLVVTLGDDFENAAPQEAVGGLSSYAIAGSVLYHFGSGRVIPFVSGGGGYLRQLDEDNADVLTGNEIHGGGGVKLWFGSGSRRLGVRVDARASARNKSAAFEQKRRIVPVLGAGLMYLF